MSSTPDNAQFTVGCICALPDEQKAVASFLDQEYGPANYQAPGDNNDYTLGRIGRHNVVIAVCPRGQDGLVPAASVARDLARTFLDVRIALMVGIGGCAPSIEHDIRLGDVIVSSGSSTTPAVVQYDKGKWQQRNNSPDGSRQNLVRHRRPDSFQIHSLLNQPPQLLLTAITNLESYQERNGNKIRSMVTDAVSRVRKNMQRRFTMPDVSTDVLYKPGFVHQTQTDPGIDKPCCGTDEMIIQPRSERDIEEDDIAVHYGPIGTASALMKDAYARDELSRRHGILCFEMESGGLMNQWPCLVIRGQVQATKPMSELLDLQQTIAKDTNSTARSAATIAAHTGELIAGQKASAEKFEKIYEADIARHLSARHLECIRMFNKVEYNTFKSDVLEKRIANTCSWTLDHPLFKEWIAGRASNVLWISADPGCGKSVLARSLVEDDIPALYQGPVQMCHFFFKDNAEQSMLCNALCSVLHQIFDQQPQLVQHAMPYLDKHGHGITGDIDVLWKILLDSGSDAAARSFVCVFDALDECRDKDQLIFIRLLGDLHQRQQLSLGHLRFKILVTSRPYRIIEQAFGKGTNNLPEIHLRGELENEQINREINLVIKHRVDSLATEHGLTADFRSKLQRTLTNMENRTYLWLFLVWKDIEDQVANSWFRDSYHIPSIPQTLDETYEKILDKASIREQNDVRKILKIVVAARRPLSVHEMAIVLSGVRPTMTEIKFDEELLSKKIRHLCGLFVFIKNSTVHLLHQTAKEFLLRKDATTTVVSKWAFEASEAESLMAILCIRYLILTHERALSGETDTDKSADSMYAYAAQRWPEHYRESAHDIEIAISMIIAKLYDPKSMSRRAWFTLHWNHIRPYSQQPDMPPIIMASFSGHDEIVHMLLANDPAGLECRDSRGMTPLMCAAEQGHVSTAALLLSNHAEVNAQGGLYDTALYAAASGGHEAVLKLLLHSDAEVNMHGGRYGNALQAAAAAGHQAVVGLLLEHGAHVNARGGDYGNALQAAACGGRKAVIELLLEKGAEVNTLGGLYGYALQAAASEGHEAVVRLLLNNGADVNAQGGDYGNALYAAASRGHEVVARLLLDEGADVNARGGDYGNALQAAVSRGHQAVIKLLLNRGARVNAQTAVFGNALYGAAYTGEEERLKTLFKKNLDVTVEASGTGTLPSEAASEGQKILFDLLLDAGAEINPLHAALHSPAYNAVIEEHSDTARLLVDHFVDATDVHGISRSQYAASLLKQPPDVDDWPHLLRQHRDYLGRSLLHFAALNKSETIVNAYVGFCGNIEVTDHFGWTPLHWAVHVGNVPAITSLCQNGASTLAEDIRKDTPLDLAVHGAIQVVIDAISPFILESEMLEIRPQEGPRLLGFCDCCGQEFFNEQYHSLFIPDIHF
ncbi:Ankyrin repeat-containing protein 25 [Elsinoe fawcettii]|nr:Ankyrin repeat-containing protein 25 [Elsinoe fawcettii]